MVRIIIFIVLATQSFAAEQCDVLGTLEADPYGVSQPVSFGDIEGAKLVEACDEAIAKQDRNLPRYLLQRSRGQLRLGNSDLALNDLFKSHELGYPAGTFGLATAYYLGDDIEQDFVKARELYLLAYEQRVRWAARGLSMLYSNERFANNDPHLSEVWSARFRYDVPISISAPTDLVDMVLDDFQARCNEAVYNDNNAFDTQFPAELTTHNDNFFDIQIDKTGKLATVIYGAFACSEYGYMWTGSGGSNYFLIVDDEIYQGWGGIPYSIEYDDGYHVILPRSGIACETSDYMLIATAGACNGIANWDETLHVFNSIGNQLPVWEPKI